MWCQKKRLGVADWSSLSVCFLDSLSNADCSYFKLDKVKLLGQIPLAEVTKLRKGWETVRFVIDPS